jgi:hypothetical protein
MLEGVKKWIMHTIVPFTTTRPWWMSLPSEQCEENLSLSQWRRQESPAVMMSFNRVEE